jgi:hypothetical protein
MSADDDRTASLMTPAKLAQLKVRPAAAASPAAWLDQMAADAGSGHVRRLVDLRGQLEAQLREDEAAPVAAARAALAQGVAQLDYTLVQPKGWLARATGKGKAAAADFVAQAERAHHAAEDLEQEAGALLRKWQAPAGGLERSVLEMEVEVRAIEKIMDQGARWLQDMRNQIKERQAASSDEAVQQQAREDSARCELLVARLKLLRALASATQQAVARCKVLPERRQALLVSVQSVQEGEVRRWHKKLARVLDQATATGSAAEGTESAERAGRDLHAALEQLGRDVEALDAHRRSAVEELEAAAPALQAAA